MRSIPHPFERLTAFMTKALCRTMASTVISAFVIAGAALGTATPAFADPPELIFQNLCGSVSLTWDTGTIGDPASWDTTVLRTSVIIERFSMPSRGDREFGALDGDIFEVRRDGLPTRSFVHETPDTCKNEPRLAVTASSDCTGLQLSFTNSGAAALSGLQLMAASPVPQDLPPIGVGTQTVSFPLANGTPFHLRGPGATSGWLTWLTGTHTTPETCSTPPPVTPGGPSGGTLPVTGATAAPFLGAGALLVASGLVFLLISRRRRLQKG
jgi:LPXTG-motif cell wall-anchored protein